MWIVSSRSGQLAARFGTRSRTLAGCLAAAIALALPVVPGIARAQGSLGGQRAGTSSATFLRIGVGARAVGMGETFVAVANDPSAIFWNPAGLASLQRRELAISHVEWPADIHYEHLTLILPSRRLGGPIAMELGSVRIATSLTNFGAALRPSGTYVSPFDGSTAQYDGFDPPLMFRYGVAFEPIESQMQRLTTSFEVNQPADNEQLVKAGAEWQ